MTDDTPSGNASAQPSRLPVFTIETPSGHRLDIEAPDQETALNGAQQWHALQQHIGSGDSGLKISPDKIAEARAAGHSDADIVNYLSSLAPAKFDEAAKAGYSPTEILQHLGSVPQPSGFISNAQQGSADLLGGIGKTIEAHLGPGPVGGWLQNEAKKIAPANFVPAPIIDNSGFHASGILPALARSSAYRCDYCPRWPNRCFTST